MSSATYDLWRGYIPFTDEQIAAAMVEAASHEKEWLAEKYRYYAAKLRRDHRLSKPALRVALPYLVRRCGVCALDGIERTALYRYGSEGRCSAHRLVTTEGFLMRRKRIEARQTEFASAENLRGQQLAAADGHRRAARTAKFAHHRSKK